MIRFEKRYEPLLPIQQFLSRMARWVLAACAIVAASLLLGVCGYHFFEGLPWLDSLLNASMILGGMGPVDPLHTKAGKLFASFYALYSGLALISVAGVLIAPIAHRLLHHFHLEQPRDTGQKRNK